MWGCGVEMPAQHPQPGQGSPEGSGDTNSVSVPPGEGILPPEAGDTQPGDAGAPRGALPVPAPVRGLSPHLQVLAEQPLPTCALAARPKFPGEVTQCPALPSTWLGCPSSGGHRPLPRDHGHPLASSAAEWRVPACPSPPHLVLWPGLGQGLARGVPAVPVCPPELLPLPPPHN